MSFEPLLTSIPAFVLVVFRVAGMMMVAPFFGSARIPRRIRLAVALVISAAIVPAIKAPAFPESVWALAAGIAGEMLFGLAIGTALTFVFVAVHWAGDIIGQQMGLGMGQMFDPQFGQGGSVVSDLYYMLTLVVFLAAQGHHAFLRGLFATFDSLPLLSVGMSQGLLDLVVGLLHAATTMALRLAAPILVTMLVVDVVLGFIGKTIPQINVMTLGLTLRSVVGMMVLVLGAAMTSDVIREGLMESVDELARAWMPGAGA